MIYIYLAGARDLLLLVNANDQLVLLAIAIILIYACVQVHSNFYEVYPLKLISRLIVEMF